MPPAPGAPVHPRPGAPARTHRPAGSSLDGPSAPATAAIVNAGIGAGPVSVPRFVVGRPRAADLRLIETAERAPAAGTAPGPPPRRPLDMPTETERVSVA
ncbi:hypothetical protein ACE1SV_09050 [Streptomyces sennicomposti]